MSEVRSSGAFAPLAAVIGALFRGAREGDKRIQKRAAAVSGGVSAIGLALYVAQWGTGYLDRRAERDERRDHALVTAVEKLSGSTEANRDAVRALEGAIREQSNSNALVVKLAIERLGGPVPARVPTVRPASRESR